MTEITVKPLIATPAYGGMFCVNYVSSVVNLPTKLEFFFPSCSIITTARNECVDHFRKHEEFTHLFFIDSDIGFTEQSFIRLLATKYEITCAIYPFKSDTVTRQQGFVIDPKSLGAVKEDGFAPSLDGPTGFMCIRRSAIDKMHEAGLKPWDYFDCMVHEDGYYIHEDVAFCRRYNKITGNYVYVDTKAELSHMGMKVFRRSIQECLNGS